MSEQEPKRLEGRGEEQAGEGMRRACGITGRRGKGGKKEQVWGSNAAEGSQAGRRKS